MKISKLTFPITAEAFSAYQAALIKRELTNNERKIAAALVPAFNMSYEEGEAGDKDGLLESVQKMDELISDKEDDSIVSRFLKGARFWIIYAWDQGRRDATSARPEMFRRNEEEREQ